MTALHSCLACGRHPDTHVASGDDRCVACGLGDERKEPVYPMPADLRSILDAANVPDEVIEAVQVGLDIAYTQGGIDTLKKGIV